MSRLRRWAALALPVAGGAFVLSAVIFYPRSLPLRLGLALIGLVLIKAGSWSMASPVLPSERRFLALRREVDRFIVLVRRLNRTTLALASDASATNRAKLLEVRDEMLESVKRMEAAAGHAGDDGLADGEPIPVSGPPGSPKPA